jgi:hypothetical protein
MKRIEPEEGTDPEDADKKKPPHGVFGATTHSVHTFALSLPLLSMAVTA